MKLADLNPKDLLAVRLDSMNLSLLRVQGAQIQKAETLFIREASKEKIRETVAAFAGAVPAKDVLVILSRSEILQKELSFAKGSQQSIKEELETRLQTILPFSVKEMAWGIRMDSGAEKTEGVLMAAPEKKIREVISFLQDAGLEPGSMEIVTEDQTLLWACLENKERGPALVLERSNGRLLALFVKQGAIVFSRTFECSSETGSLTSDILAEISLKLLESDSKAQKILLAGPWSPEDQARISSHFSAPLEVFGAREPAPFWGASLYGQYPYISLLPKEEKIQKRQREKSALEKDIIKIAAVLLALFLAGSWVRAQGVDKANRKLWLQMQQNARPAAEAERIVTSLERVRAAQESKTRVLGLLKDLAVTTPSSIRLRELRVEGNEVVFSGASPSYGQVSELVEGLENTESFRKPRLRSSRLRKDGVENALDFEVTGEWKN